MLCSYRRNGTNDVKVLVQGCRLPNSLHGFQVYLISSLELWVSMTSLDEDTAADFVELKEVELHSKSIKTPTSDNILLLLLLH